MSVTEARKLGCIFLLVAFRRDRIGWCEVLLTTEQEVKLKVLGILSPKYGSIQASLLLDDAKKITEWVLLQGRPKLSEDIRDTA